MVKGEGEGGTVGTDGTNMTTLVFELLSIGRGAPNPRDTENTEWRCPRCQGCFVKHESEGTPKRCPHCFCSACADCSAPTVGYFIPMLDDPQVGPDISAMVALCDPCVTKRRTDGAELSRFIWEPPA